jgi:hypothetical protein
MGFIKEKEEYVVVIICSKNCEDKSYIKEMNWDKEKWKNIIEDSCLIKWMVKIK